MTYLEQITSYIESNKPFVLERGTGIEIASGVVVCDVDKFIKTHVDCVLQYKESNLRLAEINFDRLFVFYKKLISLQP